MFISGQIGLLPHNLPLSTPQNLPLETALACQHVERISRALKTNSGGGWEGHVQLAVYWLQNYDDVAVVREAIKDLVCMFKALHARIDLGLSEAR